MEMVSVNLKCQFAWITRCGCQPPLTPFLAPFLHSGHFYWANTKYTKNFMVPPCINNIQHFNFQLMHKTLKNVELLKHFKISETAPTCFSLQGNHHQGVSQYLAKITHLVQSGYIELVQDGVGVMAAYCDLWGVCAVHNLVVIKRAGYVTSASACFATDCTSKFAIFVFSLLSSL